MSRTARKALVRQCRTALAAMTVVVTGLAWSGGSFAADPAPPVAIATAQTRAEHEQLAQYYEQLRQASQERVATHRQRRADYERAVATAKKFPTGPAYGTSMLRNCASLIKNAERDMEAYAEMAREHTRLASAAVQ